MRWTDLLGALSHDINWSGEWVGAEAHVVEEILARVAADPFPIGERVAEILADDATYQHLEPFTEYPRTLMDKFTLYVHPSDLFRVRLHRFWPRQIAGNAIEKIHYHKWHMSTVLLGGSYVERQFFVEHCDEQTKVARLREVASQTLNAGDANSLAALTPHQVHNPSETEPCLTLFVRGPAIQGHARIFNDLEGSFYDTYSPTPQRRHALAMMGQLNGFFHPIPERPRDREISRTSEAAVIP